MADRSDLVVGIASGALAAIATGLGIALGRTLLDRASQRKLPSGGSSLALLRGGNERLLVVAPDPRLGIDFEAAVETVAAMKSLEPGPLALAVHTLGGQASAVHYLARAIRSSPHEVTAYVPYVAMSGGTIIALAANSLVMDRGAVLGPVDPQFIWGPGHILRELLQRSPEHLNEEYFIAGREAEKAIAETGSLLEELDVPPAARGRLINGDTTHGHSITLDEAVNLGLPVQEGVPAEIRERVDRAIQEQRDNRGPFLVFK